MDADEREIYYYLKGYRNEFVAAKEICRRAGGKKRFRENPEWAKAFLSTMVDRGILETDGSARYRIKPREQAEKLKRWVSPQMAEILKKSPNKELHDIAMSEDDM